ncbi:MAG: hypothetical protein ACOYB4_04865 [Methyloceanibacter sp.]
MRPLLHIALPASKFGLRADGVPVRFFTQTDYSPLVNIAGGLEMSLTPPTTWTFALSTTLAALAVIGQFAPIPIITEYGFWVVFFAFVLLVIGNLFRGI